jgi:hypothetical protein
LDDLIIENRHLAIEEKTGNQRYDALLKTLIWYCKSRKKMDSPLFLKKLQMKRFTAFFGTENNVLPELATKSFSQQWRERNL